MLREINGSCARIGFAAQACSIDFCDSDLHSGKGRFVAYVRSDKPETFVSHFIQTTDRGLKYSGLLVLHRLENMGFRMSIGEKLALFKNKSRNRSSR
ncbi:hypothetical protein CKO25_10635 [Thiocapsa imhoffii]|uniref:Uncharacterized protein n=1 Tax=Thiocapsa imhoffii TaxID=382777 RepID=A0A9X0WIX0_9GAMM|nr:hypothetical protein [Thiocapsa imhoffii]